MWVLSVGLKDPLEEDMAPHSSILALKIPWTEEPGRPVYGATKNIWCEVLNDNDSIYPIKRVQSIPSLLGIFRRKYIGFYQKLSCIEVIIFFYSFSFNVLNYMDWTLLNQPGIFVSGVSPSWLWVLSFLYSVELDLLIFYLEFFTCSWERFLWHFPFFPISLPGCWIKVMLIS